MTTAEITDNGYESMHVAAPNDNFVNEIAAAIRRGFTEDNKVAMMMMAENIMAKVIEDEMRQFLEPKFEALYEGVIASVMQKLLLQALTQRASETLKAITEKD